MNPRDGRKRRSPFNVGDDAELRELASETPTVHEITWLAGTTP